MPLTFVNGGSPTYPGVSFTSQTGLLTLLHDTLVTAGWFSIVNTPGANLIRLSGQSGFNQCYLQAEVINNKLSLRGSLDDGFNLTLSPVVGDGFMVDWGLEFEMTFTPGSDNRVWVTADESSFCIMVKDFNEANNIYAGWRFGWYDRWDENDSTAWGFAPLWTLNAYNFVARAAFDNALWDDVSSRFRNTVLNPSESFDQTDSVYPMEGYVSVYTQGLTSTLSSTVNANQFDSFRHYGNVNGYNGLVTPSLNYVLEGYNVDQDYSQIRLFQSQTTGIPLYYRGTVRFTATGFAHIATPGTVTTLTSGEVYITPGKTGLGMLIDKP